MFLYLRVELHKRKVSEQCDVEQEMMCQELRHRKVALDVTIERINIQLLVRMLDYRLIHLVVILYIYCL